MGAGRRLWGVVYGSDADFEQVAGSGEWWQICAEKGVLLEHRREQRCVLGGIIGALELLELVDGPVGGSEKLKLRCCLQIGLQHWYEAVSFLIT